MVYKYNFIYKIHCGTDVTDDVTDNIVVRGCPSSIPGCVLKKKQTTYICIFILYVIYIVYILYIIYIVYILYAYYIYIYIAYICRVKSVWYINKTSFTTYIGSPR